MLFASVDAVEKHGPAGAPGRCTWRENISVGMRLQSTGREYGNKREWRATHFSDHSGKNTRRNNLRGPLFWLPVSGDTVSHSGEGMLAGAVW